MINIISLLKSIVYRIFASCITSLIAFIFTGNFVISLSIGIFEFISKIFAYYIYEELWNNIIRYFSYKLYRKNCYKFNQNGKVILVTGLNCSGKTTIAKELKSQIQNSILLDGDAIRKSINYDLGFSKNDIHTNLMKITNLANLLTDQGYNVIISCISKFKNDREFIKNSLISKNYNEIYVYCNDKIRNSRLKILHPETKILQTNYEKSDYNVINIDTSKKDIKSNVQYILCQLKD